MFMPPDTRSNRQKTHWICLKKSNYWSGWSVWPSSMSTIQKNRREAALIDMNIWERVLFQKRHSLNCYLICD